jgi:hypothetical protein
VPLCGTEASALVVGAKNPSWDHVFDGQTAELGDVFRTTKRMQSGDRRVRDVD